MGADKGGSLARPVYVANLSPRRTWLTRAPRPKARSEKGPRMDAGQADDTTLSPFVRFSREEWGRLYANTPLLLSEDDVRNLRRIGRPHESC